MTAPLYSPAELDAMAADAERIDMSFPEYVEHLQESCVGHAAVLILRPAMRPAALATLPVQTRLTTIALLEIIDEMLPGDDADDTPLRDALIEKAEAHLALLRGDL